MAPLIDVHHHFIPPVLVSQQRERLLAGIAHMGSPSVLLEWSLARALDEMDRTGVAVAIASIAPPGVSFGDAAAAAALARACNDFLAESVRAHPARFGFFAALPLPDVDATLAEIAYAFDELGADGVGFLSSYDDRWPGDPAFVPVLEELDRRHALVYVHATAPACCRSLIPGIPPPVTEYPFDTTRAITSLLFGGALTRFANIRFVFSHGGGPVAVLAGRIAGFRERREDLVAASPEGVPALLARLHYDLASATSRAAFAALRETVPVTQLLFGSDAPYIPIAATARGLDDLALNVEERSAIATGNAVALLPRLAGLLAAEDRYRTHV